MRGTFVYDCMSRQAHLHHPLVAPSNSRGCAVPNPLQRAGIKIQAAIAKKTNRTIGVGFAGSVGWGIGGPGLIASATAQMVVQPNGSAALVYTITPPSGGYLSPLPGKEEGGAALVGFTLSVSKGSALPISFDASYQNVGVNINSAGGVVHCRSWIRR
jgi:hypothetical protein